MPVEFRERAGAIAIEHSRPAGKVEAGGVLIINSLQKTGGKGNEGDYTLVYLLTLIENGGGAEGKACSFAPNLILSGAAEYLLQRGKQAFL